MVSDTKGPACGVEKRLTSDTHIDQICIVDMFGNLAEELYWKREDSRHNSFGGGCLEEVRPTRVCGAQIYVGEEGKGSEPRLGRKF